jgi:hypothetical protein
MARTVRRVRVVGNPPRRRRKARAKRHNLSAKQIKYFGTPAQKAALKRSRAAKRSNASRKATTVRHKRHTRRRATKRRQNIGEILSLTLGNPPRKARRVRKNRTRKAKGATMAATKRRRRRRAPNSGGTRRRRRTTRAASPHRRRRTYRTNAGKRPRVHRHYSRGHVRAKRRGRRIGNPGMGGFGAEIMDTLWMIGGAVGTQMLTQAVLQGNNVSWMGYAGNLVAGFALSLGLRAMPNAALKAASKSVFKGAVLQVVLRILRDQTPFGQFTSSIGMGDYLASNWVTPQRYVDPLGGAQIQIPAGWGAPPPAATKGGGAKGGVSGVTDFGSLYSPAGSGLYN